MARGKPIYKISFHNRGKLYELHARRISSGALLGFVEVEGLLFGATGSGVLVDPSEERLKAEFSGVKRTYIPLQAVVRIDEVEKEGANKISPLPEQGENVTPFPAHFTQRDKT
jgi:hypothetical protein